MKKLRLKCQNKFSEAQENSVILNKENGLLLITSNMKANGTIFGTRWWWKRKSLTRRRYLIMMISSRCRQKMMMYSKKSCIIKVILRKKILMKILWRTTRVFKISLKQVIYLSLMNKKKKKLWGCLHRLHKMNEMEKIQRQ